MKKTVITLALSAIASVAFAQGNVIFANTSGPLVSTNGTVEINRDGTANNGVGTGGIGLTATSTAAPSGYYYALLMQSYAGTGPTASASLTSLSSEGWLYSGLTGVNALGQGKIAGGANAVTTAGDSGPAGTANQFIVVAWTANEGTTWSAFDASLTAGTLFAGGDVGISTVGTGTESTQNPEQLFLGTGINSPISMDVVVGVPEPGTMVLAGLGGLSLLAFRRKK